MREGTAEVRSVDIGVLLLGHIHVLAAGAVHLHPGGADILAHSDGEDVLPLAEDPGAHSELAEQELLPHQSETLGREDEPGVDESINVGGLLIQLQEFFVFELVLIGGLWAEDHGDCLATVTGLAYLK